MIVEPIHVDHSVPGAYGYLIHTSAGTIAYTGDLRRHGPASFMTDEFAEKASKSDPVALICEGTRVRRREKGENLGESGVKKLAKDVISKTIKLAIATFYGRDVDRIRTFYEVAKESRARPWPGLRDKNHSRSHVSQKEIQKRREKWFYH